MPLSSWMSPEQPSRPAGMGNDWRIADRPNNVTGGEGGEHSEKLAPIAVRARHLLAVNLAAIGGAQLFKLGVERLAVGADAGIARGDGFRARFQSYLTGSATP